MDAKPMSNLGFSAGDFAVDETEPLERDVDNAEERIVRMSGDDRVVDRENDLDDRPAL
jgi:hypothetical protein